jgi:hypothetical protein
VLIYQKSFNRYQAGQWEFNADFSVEALEADVQAAIDSGVVATDATVEASDAAVDSALSQGAMHQLLNVMKNNQ